MREDAFISIFAAASGPKGAEFLSRIVRRGLAGLHQLKAGDLCGAWRTVPEVTRVSFLAVVIQEKEATRYLALGHLVATGSGVAC